MAAATMSNNTISTIHSNNNNMEVDKLTYEIFSILENKFLFGYNNENTPKCHKTRLADHIMLNQGTEKTRKNGKIRILSIDGGGSTNGILAAKSLAHLEATLRRKTGNNKACISDFFDVVAGSGTGGALAGLLFTRGKDGFPVLTAEESLRFLLDNGRKFSRSGIFQRNFRPGKVFDKIFDGLTLKDTFKTVLIPCYDLTTKATVLFSRADALEMDGCDYKMADVCGATLADRAVEIKSVDGKRKITAVGGGVAMNNPTAAAITHVLNNKQEFPFVNGVEDLLVVSLGNGESDPGDGNLVASPAALVKIAGDGAADMVDQAVSMAFGQFRNTNYVRVQGTCMVGKKHRTIKDESMKNSVAIAEKMLRQKNVESLLFQGKKLAENTNLDKLETFAGELIKEQERRKTSMLSPPLVLKQASPSPRSSSATTLSTISSC